MKRYVKVSNKESEKAMEWTEYISKELSRHSKLKGLQIKYSDEGQSSTIPPIIRISLDILNRFLLSGEKRLVIVFPEGNLSPFMLMTMKIISDILEGHIKSTYDPNTFKKGQKLKCGNCVVEFDHIDIQNDASMLYVRNADCVNGIPLEAAPMFQLTDTNRRLSKDIEFSKIKKIIREQKVNCAVEDSALMTLIENKTHFDNTTFSVSPIGKTQSYFDRIKINGKSIKELLLIGHAGEDGAVEVTSKGQLVGNPSIVIAADLYAVCAAIKKTTDIKMLFIDISNANIINGQLDALDDLKSLGFPIICLTDTANSFNLSSLEDRDFFIWRWDEESISESLVTNETNPIIKKVNICFNQDVIYLEGKCPLIDEVFSTLYNIKNMVSDSTGAITVIYEKLFSIGFQYLRTLKPLTNEEINLNKNNLDWCAEQLLGAIHYCDPKLFESLSSVIQNLEKQNCSSASLPKIQILENVLLDDQTKKCCIIPEKTSKEQYTAYWDMFCRNHNIVKMINFITFDEYISEENLASETTIVCGWIGKEKMRKILYGYKTKNIIVLIYGYEKLWQSPHIKSWKKVLHNGSKRKIAEKIISNQGEDNNLFFSFTDLEVQAEPPDELEEINITLRENQYKRYLAHGGVHSIDETSESIPVYFIGGYFTFYKITHKVISVGDIVFKGKSEIHMIYPQELSVGDFIVVREAERDIIKEMADKILSASGKAGMRKMAMKWKESLELESRFTSFDDIYSRLRLAGCSKEKITVRQWMNNDDIISPQEKADLEFVAQITDDEVLHDLIDEVFEAGKVVKSAHIQAGRNLSVLLKDQIAEQLKEMGEIDPYNIWEPIDMQIEGIGNVKLLKVIDIGSKIMVDNTNINRLIHEY